jgi:hypothetical protein
MKSFLFIFSFLTFSGLYSQMCPCEFGGKNTDRPLRFELGFNTLNFNEVTVFNDNHKKYRHNVVNGVMFKYHLDRYTVRAGFDYSEHNYSYRDSTYFFYQTKGKSFGKYFRLGVEKTLSKTKLQIYLSSDLIFAFEQFNGISGTGDFGWAGYNNPYRFKVISYGFSPAFGLRYRPLKHFSISAETSLIIGGYYRYSQEGTYKNLSAKMLIINPLRLLSINYHF